MEPGISAVSVADPERVESRVRAWRERAGLRPGELAAQAGLTRQALHAIESGTVPGTLSALRLARALGCAVEDLFRLTPGPVPVVAPMEPAQVTLPVRVRLAQVGPHLRAYALHGAAGLNEAADGVAQAWTGAPAEARITLLGDPDPAHTAQTRARAAHTLVLAGCDPALGVLGQHFLGQPTGPRGPHRLTLLDRSSLDALRLLASGTAHAAGIHLWDRASGESNLPFVRRELAGHGAHLYTLWAWEQGLLVARGNPLALRGVRDLTRRGVRLVNREGGAGSRLLLDTWLEAAGVAPEALRGYADEATSPLLAAQRVAQGLADAAPGPRSAALSLGLDFVPLQTERFDLVVPAAHLGHPALATLLNTARHPAFQAELRALGGYDPTHAGELWQSTA